MNIWKIGQMNRNTNYRKKAINAKGKYCHICDSGKNLDNSDTNVIVHHIDGDKSNENLDNLIPLCNTCHWMIHNGNHELSKHLPIESRSDMGGFGNSDGSYPKMVDVEIQIDKWHSVWCSLYSVDLDEIVQKEIDKLMKKSPSQT